MCIEIDSLDDAVFNEYANWIQTSGLWDGRHVSIENADEFQKEVEERIARLFSLLNENSQEYYDLLIKLARMGTSPESLPLLDREIQSLKVKSDEVTVTSCSRKHGKHKSHKQKSSASKFWKKYKKEILIGLGVATVVTVVVVVTVCSGGAAGAAVGSAVACGLKRKDSESDDSNILEPLSRPNFESKNSSQFPHTQILDISHPSKPLASANNPYLLFQESLKQPASSDFFSSLPTVSNPGIAKNPHFNAWNYKSLESIGNNIFERKFTEPNPIEPFLPFNSHKLSCASDYSKCRVGGINGMLTTKWEAKKHAEYMKSLIHTNSIDWTYNRTNRLAGDLEEIFFLNYAGYSPNTANHLQDNWIEFDRDNRDNPNMKYLQFCHSQGALHVRNALASAPKEIRGRVIVIAIAPAGIVPKHLCFASFNYTSEKDVIHYGEVAYASALNPDEFWCSPLVDTVLEYREQLIYLPPAPISGWFDHDFRSPTFLNVIKNHIDDYCNKHKGEYK